MSAVENHLFCFGYGYTSDYLGHALMAQGWKVSGTTRDSEKRKELRARGINAYLFDDEVPLPDAQYILRDVTHILVSTPPDDHGDPSFGLYAQDILAMPHLCWLGYLSTTGVYGDRAGGVVDENSEIRPSTIRGSRRARAEEQWLSLLQHGHHVPVHVFRLAGIYGPGRSALDSVRAGVARRIDKPGHAFSRIHVEDIVQILRASIAQPQPGHAYNVCDDVPAPSHEVIDYACQLLGLTSPPLIPFDKVDLAPITQSFYADNKRVRNDRIKQELGISLRYPSFREGLLACLEAEKTAITALLPQKKTSV